jgi:hypothetical protein
MQATNTNKKLIEGYLELFKYLSPQNKLDLISRLSDSLKSNKKVKKVSLDTLKADFITEKSADESINELEIARNFNRKTESF